MKSSPVAVRVNSPAAVVAAVPYLLGFHPTESLVLIAVTGRQVTLTTRVDLSGSAAEQIVDSILPALSQADPDEALLVAFTHLASAATEDLMAAVAALLRDLGIRVTVQLVVTGRRWRALPMHGKEGAEGGLWDAAADQVRAEFVGAGVAPGASREALAARLSPSSDADRVEALLTADDPGSRDLDGLLGRFAASWPLILTPPGDVEPELSPEVAADAIASLGDTTLRDLLLGWLLPGTVDLDTFPDPARDALPAPWLADPSATGDAAQLLDRLLHLARLTPPPYAPPLTVLAAYAWSRGDGATAHLALQRALGADPHYRLAVLLDLMVRTGIRITD